MTLQGDIPLFFSSPLFQGRADKAPGSQSRTLPTFIGRRNRLQDQEWAHHPKATFPQNASLVNSSSATGSSKVVGGQQAITVVLTTCCSHYPKLAEPHLLMSSNEPSIIALTGTWRTSPVDDAEISLSTVSKLIVVVENFSISLLPSLHASGWGTDRRCWNLCSPNFATQPQQSNYWHHWEILITHYYPSNLVFMTHTSPHVQGLNGATMSE